MASCPYADKTDPWSSHSRTLAWLAALPAGSRVLDVGTASGTLGRLGAGLPLALYGLEPNPEWAELARPYYRAVLCSTLEEAPDDFLAGYAAVVCDDVLEHMAWPRPALQRLVALQPAGSLFIVSVPNVANLWVRLQLLMGRFDYADRGILDRTHLRFFTRRAFAQMLRAAGLETQEIAATALPLGLVHRFFRSALGRGLHRSLSGLTRVFPTLLGYQFVARAVKLFQDNPTA
jgi:2-polyprenyl-3-methyl-5-hydroxy-6-metoxy-1,4-benzoquinol methylase